MKKVERISKAVKVASTLEVGSISKVKGTRLSVANKGGKLFLLGDKKEIRNRDGRMMGQCFKDITSVVTRRFSMGLTISDNEYKNLI